MLAFNYNRVEVTADDLSMLKVNHIRIDYNEDDDYIAYLYRNALRRILAITNRPLEELKEMGGGEIPEELRFAAMQLAAHWYRVRENVSSINQAVVPMGFHMLVKPFVKLATDD